MYFSKKKVFISSEMAKCNLKVNSPHVDYSDDYISVNYSYLTTKVQKQGDDINVSLI